MGTNRAFIADASRHAASGRLAFFIVVLLACVPQAAVSASAAPAHAVMAPLDAHEKLNRHDLAELVKSGGEARVIVGLTGAGSTSAADTEATRAERQRDFERKQQGLVARLASHRVRGVKALRDHPFVALTVDADGVNALLADPEVASVAEDRQVSLVLHDTPALTRADKAWAQGARGSGQAVAILDTGVDWRHPFFAGKILAEACFSAPVAGAAGYCPNGTSRQIGTGAGVNCPDSNLGCWHGTHVAGIAAGNFGTLSPSTGGIGRDAAVIAIQVFQRTCSTTSCSLTAYESDLLLALEHVYSLRTTHAIAAVNMSLGGQAYSGACDGASPAMSSVIQSLRGAGIATVVAAGNGGSASSISFPACISSAISVGSTTKAREISGFSNSAGFLSLLAPGTGIVSSVPGGGYGTASGTSMATPHVAGAWALLKSAKPAATVTEVLTALQNGGFVITDPRNGIAKSMIQIGYDGVTSGALGILLGQGNAVPAAPGAVFVGADATTQGNWKGKYGSNGYAIINDSTNYPTYAQVSASGQASYMWSENPSADPRALQRAAAGRIAATWFSGSQFNVDINLTDGAAHRVALYMLDWDSIYRVVRVDVLDAVTQQVLNTQTVQSFNSGAYLIWNLKGHVILRFTTIAGPNAVLSGIFFDAPGAPGSATFLGADGTTQGNWKGRYGSSGYSVINDSTSFPAYARVSAWGNASYTWADHPDSDPRALQRAASGRVAATWFSGSTFHVDIELVDSVAHRVALYLLDWDSVYRVVRVDVIDAVTQQVLNTQTLQSFNAGAYLLWNLKGHVTLRFTTIAGANAVLSGIFFD